MPLAADLLLLAPHLAGSVPGLARRCALASASSPEWHCWFNAKAVSSRPYACSGSAGRAAIRVGVSGANLLAWVGYG